MFYKLANVIGAFCLFMLYITNSFALTNPNSNIDSELRTAMKIYHVPVVGYAIIKNNKIVAANTLSNDFKIKVSKNSLFQAASISKSVSAYGALKLVSQGKLNLDESVNNRLTTWKIPINKYNLHNPVTLRQILAMTSGLSGSGFPGHLQGDPLPTLKEILDGKTPAKTPAIKVFYKPGTQYFYSGGGFQVLELLIADTTQQPFSDWITKEILTPLHMEQSIFQYPLHKKWHAVAVPGFLSDGTMIKDGWHNYPIASAGGLWSTPTDVAQFAIHVSNSYLGKNNQIISKSIAQQMLTRQLNSDYGLGVVINGEGKTLNFRKAGHNDGYHNQLLMFPNSGDGVVIMTNSENGEYVINYIIPVIAKKYHWPCYFPFFDELIEIPSYAC